MSMKMVERQYTSTGKAVYSTQSEVTDAFVDGMYPEHTDGELRSSNNFRAYQYEDGSGKIMHYRTIETIRTRSGLIFSNAECWSGGFAHCSKPLSSHRDGDIPLNLIRRLIRGTEHDIYDIQRYFDNSIVEFPDGSQVFFSQDETHHRPRPYFAFFIENGVNSAEEAEALLMPDEVGDEYVRQGEWFFIPDEDYSPQAPILKPFTFTDSTWDMSHVKTEDYVEFDEIRDEPLRSCPECGSQVFDMHSHRPIVTCRPCNYTVIYDELVVEDFIVHDKYTSAEKRLGNHVPRDLTVENGEIYVRGTVRHRRNEHTMLNLGEVWHKAVTHDQNVMTSGGGHD